MPCGAVVPQISLVLRVALRWLACSHSILGNQGAVSWVGKNGGESFQERMKETLGCYPLQTSSTTYSNAALWLGTKIFFRPIRGQSYKKFTRKLDCSLYLSVWVVQLSSRRVFNEMGQNPEINCIIRKNFRVTSFIYYTCSNFLLLRTNSWLKRACIWGYTESLPTL